LLKINDNPQSVAVHNKKRRLVVRKLLVLITITISIAIIPTADAALFQYTPELILSKTHTDNLFLSPDNEQWSYINSVGLNITAEILGRTSGLSINYNPTYNTYSEFEEFDYWRHAANATLWKVFKRNTRLELNNSYLRSNDPLDESDLPVEEGQSAGPAIEADLSRRGRDQYYTNVAEARLSHQFGARDEVFISIAYRAFREVDPLPDAETDNSDAVVPSLGLVYHFSQKWSSELEGSYEHTQYQDRNDRKESNALFRFLYLFTPRFSGFLGYRHTLLRFDPDETRDEEDYDIYSPFIGLRYQTGNATNVELGVAYYKQVFDQSEEEEGFTLNSDIDTRWQFRYSYLGLSAGSGYDIDDNGTEDNQLNIYGYARIEYGYNFTPYFLGTIYSRYRYDNFPDEDPERVRNTAGAGAALSWQATKWLELALSGDYSDVASDDREEEYTEKRAMLTVRIFSPHPLRLEESEDVEQR
jgi:hypothetical protein